MHAHEPLAIVMNERKKISFLLRIHLQVAARQAEHGIEVIRALGIEFELLLRQYFRVGAYRRVPKSSLLAKPFDHRHGVRHRLVPIAFFLS
jgi:hypothetical protein